MKLQILETFRDKYTNEVYEANTIVNFNDERAKELLNDSRNLVKKVATSKKEK